MSTGTIVVVIVAVIVVLALALLVARPMMRRRRLQQRFGPEYERTVEAHDSRTSAERELADREKRFAELDIRPLSDEARENYGRRWAEVQAAFVDSPEDSIREADQLVVQVMRERGYPTEGYEQQLADLSNEHAQTLDHYRSGHDIRERIGSGVSTEDLRVAFVHYRAVFADLLGTDGGRSERDREVADVREGREMDREPLDRAADRPQENAGRADPRPAEAQAQQVDADASQSQAGRHTAQ
jgi:hypothetical protein